MIFPFEKSYFLKREQINNFLRLKNYLIGCIQFYLIIDNDKEANQFIDSIVSYNVREKHYLVSNAELKICEELRDIRKNFHLDF